MRSTVTATEAQQGRELVSKALSGEEVVVSRDNTPLLKLVPLGAPSTPRKPGSARGQVTMTPDFGAT